jgi:hypothetical protein
MPAVSQLSVAAIAFQRNNEMLAKSYRELSTEEWLRRPCETSNDLLWIVGHLVWARSMALRLLGVTWSRPWLSLFARGAKRDSPEQYPSPEELVLAWQNVSRNLVEALENATETVLSAPAPSPSPSFDGTVGGMVDFLAFHEAYHVGQAAYLRSWLGRKGAAG